MVVGTVRQPLIKLFFQGAQPSFPAEQFDGLVGFLAVVADRAEDGVFALHEGDLGEGLDLVLIVDFLVDDVPDEEEVVDVRVGPVGVEVVEQQFGGHELGGVDEEDDQGRVGRQERRQLLFGSEVLHPLD